MPLLKKVALQICGPFVLMRTNVYQFVLVVGGGTLVFKLIYPEAATRRTEMEVPQTADNPMRL
jgi:hypothetical protein